MSDLQAMIDRIRVPQIGGEISAEVKILEDRVANTALLLRRACRRLKGPRVERHDDAFIAKVHRYLRDNGLMGGPLK